MVCADYCIYKLVKCIGRIKWYMPCVVYCILNGFCPPVVLGRNVQMGLTQVVEI